MKKILSILAVFCHVILMMPAAYAGSVPSGNENDLYTYSSYLDTSQSGSILFLDDDDDELPVLPISELPLLGWALHHPKNNNVQVIFESFPLMNCMPNFEPSRLHLLEFEDLKCSGFLYIKWDQFNFQSKVTFQKHLDEILQDIMSFEPNQIFADDYEYDLDQGYGILRGSPYGLITLSGEGFLFGFAVRAAHVKYDINELIHKVKWVIEYN
jgi:hypothetical protein